MSGQSQWCCHHCLKYNDNTTTFCQVCRKSNNYVNTTMVLPFHGSDAKSLRPGQLSNLFENGLSDVNASCDEQWTSLHHACAKSNFTVVRELVNLGADINAYTSKGFTPLHLAVQSKSVVMVEFLLLKGAKVSDVATYHEKMTPLHFAAELELKQISEMILSYHPNVNAQNIIGRTPLHLAAKTGNCDVADVLLTRGADINALDFHGWCPRQVAEYHQHPNFNQFLVQFNMLHINKEKEVVEQLPPTSWHGPDWDIVVEQFEDVKKQIYEAEEKVKEEERLNERMYLLYGTDKHKPKMKTNYDTDDD